MNQSKILLELLICGFNRLAQESIDKDVKHEIIQRIGTDIADILDALSPNLSIILCDVLNYEIYQDTYEDLKIRHYMLQEKYEESEYWNGEYRQSLRNLGC